MTAPEIINVHDGMLSLQYIQNTHLWALEFGNLANSLNAVKQPG